MTLTAAKSTILGTKFDCASSVGASGLICFYGDGWLQKVMAILHSGDSQVPGLSVGS